MPKVSSCSNFKYDLAMSSAAVPLPERWRLIEDEFVSRIETDRQND
jgi:hypothetical protein